MARSEFASAREIRKRVLFLSQDDFCCGRFCEELFNHSAAQRGLDWRWSSNWATRARTSTLPDAAALVALSESL